MTLTADHPPASRAALPRRPLPVLDVGPVLAGDAAAIETLAAEWRAVWENLGFLCIVNHSIPPAAIDGMMAEARRFHDLPVETRMSVAVTTDQKGFIPARRGLTTHSAFHARKKLDTVECYVVATDFAADDPRVVAGKRFYGKMPWLPEAVLPGFRAATESYMARITDLGKRLLPVWARALDLPADYFASRFAEAYTYFRIAKYPPQPAGAIDDMGVSEHVDTGFMTFLPPANEEGLQVLDADGTWFWPEVPDGAIIVNAGQFLERWTNGRFRATPHRVVPPVAADRYSLACFVNPSFDALGECLPTCTGPDNPPRYPAQTYWEFFDWYMTNTFTHYGKVKAAGDGTVEGR